MEMRRMDAPCREGGPLETSAVTYTHLVLTRPSTADPGQHQLRSTFSPCPWSSQPLLSPSLGLSTLPCTFQCLSNIQWQSQVLDSGEAI